MGSFIIVEQCELSYMVDKRCALISYIVYVLACFKRHYNCIMVCYLLMGSMN